MIQITSNSGVPFNVRIVFIGDHYGLRDCLTHGLGECGNIDPFDVERGPLIEFYDARYVDNCMWKRGQFVSRYFVESLQFDRKDGCGLTLDGGCEGWWLDAKALEIALSYAECKIAHRKWKEAHK